jgi:hypothetical protein
VALLALGAAIFRLKAILIAENLCLRQQLVVVQRRPSASSPEQRRAPLLDAGKSMVLSLMQPWRQARPQQERLASQFNFVVHPPTFG